MWLLCKWHLTWHHMLAPIIYIGECKPVPLTGHMKSKLVGTLSSPFSMKFNNTIQYEK